MMTALVNWSSPIESRTNREDLMQLFGLAYAFHLFYLPLLILLGLFGNLMSILLIFGTRLSRIPPNQYLAYLCVSDSLFLLSLTPIWLILWRRTDNETDQLEISSFICQIHVYLMNCCSWTSSWIITALTLERFVVVTQRTAYAFGKITAGSNRASWITLSILPFPLFFNSYVFFWVGVSEQGICDILPDFIPHAFILNYMDTFAVFLLPLVVNLVVNVNIFRKLWHRKSNMTRLVVSGQSSLRRHMTTSMVVRQRHQLAKILIVVPLVFLALNLPSYSLRIFHFFRHNNDPQSMSALLSAVSDLALMLNYTNFGINFLVYCLASRSFRAAPGNLWKFNRANRRRSVNLRCSRSPQLELLQLGNADSSQR